MAAASHGRRLRELLVCGIVDSLGLSLGWTVFNLLAVRQGGLTEAAMFNAAMLGGIVLAAPATTWLSRRAPGRDMLRASSAVEAVLRVVTLAELLAGWPAQLIVPGVVALYAAGFTGFAAMRAEVAATDARPRAMTGYGMSIAATEAAGAGLAATLPDRLLPIILTLYGLSLIPTFLSANHSRVGRTSAIARVRVPGAVLAGGVAVALVAYGPTLLYVALTTELYGQAWVAGAAIAFTAGCLLSTSAVEAVGRLRLGPTVEWPLWGLGMLAGWLIAPWSPVALMLAQFMSGLCLTAFEGGMDSQAARDSHPSAVTTVLAWTAATRAMGGAVAVRLLPVVIAAPAIGAAAGTGAMLLAVGGLAATVVSVTVYSYPGRHRAIP
jgi:hypothetical protein